MRTRVGLALAHAGILALPPAACGHPPVSALALGCIALLLLFSVLEARAVRHLDRVRPRGSAYLLSLASAIALLLTAWVAIGSARGHAGGAVLLLAGIGLRVAAIETLGDRFTSAVVPSGPRVERGVYRWLRHPSEVGLVLVAIGLAVLGGSAGAGACALVVAGTAALRIILEERAFARHTRLPAKSVSRAAALRTLVDLP